MAISCCGAHGSRTPKQSPQHESTPPPSLPCCWLTRADASPVGLRRKTFSIPYVGPGRCGAALDLSQVLQPLRGPGQWAQVVDKVPVVYAAACESCLSTAASTDRAKGGSKTYLAWAPPAVQRSCRRSSSCSFAHTARTTSTGEEEESLGECPGAPGQRRKGGER